MATSPHDSASSETSNLEHLEVSIRSATSVGADALIEQLSTGANSRATTLSLSLHGRSRGIRVPSLLKTLPHLRSAVVFADDLSMSDPGWRSHVADLVHAHVTAKARRAELAAGFLLDDNADALATLAGRVSSLTAVREASRALMQDNLTVRWIVPATASLAFRLEALFSIAKDDGVDVVLVPSDAAVLAPDALLFIKDFILYRLLDEERASLSDQRIAYCEGLLAYFDPDQKPNLKHVTTAHLLLEGDAVRSMGPVSLEPPSPWLTRPSTASHVQHARKRLVSDVREVATEGQRALLQWARTQITGRGRPEYGAHRELPSVLLIGAYGGEHIGDIAILGGVLFRIHQRYKTTRAILVSQRADHTRHLVPMLDTPVELSVATYDQSTIRNHLEQVDGVVFAGGPLMDLPKQLTKHLYAVSLARRMQKPFVAEGIGAGPFARKPSEWVARRLVRMAERISVRTTDDAEKPLVSGLLPERGHDPAFDYLATRPEALTRVPVVDKEWLQRLLKDTDGRITVGLNLRPIRHLFTVGENGSDRSERTLDVEGRFYTELADGLRRFRDKTSKQVSVIFFPMNAIQFGMSDLRSAYRLGRLLGSEMDFRVWEGDASLDGVVELLRKLDIVITMRFHATIFALSQKRPVIGIDYRVGKRDKVAALLDDCGQPDQYQRIDQLTGIWLADRLEQHRKHIDDHHASSVDRI